jgi:CrcB protein
MLQKLLWLAGAGALGTLSRYFVGGFVQRLGGDLFPWGTLAVNVIGCFLFGLIWPLAEHRLIISVETRLIVLTGFMGAFTTFSTYAFETGMRLSEAQWSEAIINIAAQNGLGLLAVVSGICLGRLI